MLKLKISTLQKEHERGFRTCSFHICAHIVELTILFFFPVLPDLTIVENASLLERWEGSWAYLSTLAWVRVSKSGDVKTASFPPKSDH